MKLITKNSDYAIRALRYLACGKDCFVSSREISEKEKIPLLFLRRILQVLIKKKIIISKEGTAGGIKLNKDAGKISIASVIKIFQGDIQLSECMFRKELCQNRNKCLMRKKILDIEKIVENEFKKITVKDLLI
ncbi:MAG: Rrf2 family transcriptional regulator [Candidatus Omnitrophota bacterium]